jgi:Fur family ferric uptake transcriptional regulator
MVAATIVNNKIRDKLNTSCNFQLNISICSHKILTLSANADTTISMEKETSKIVDIVKQKFDEYLTANKCRKTPERYAILNLIYSESRHFDIDTLYNTMLERNFRVSRATLYNTMQLLQNCNLVLKHQFGQNITLYERAYSNDFHHHLICTHCNKVQEYKDVKLKIIIQNKKIKNFTPVQYNLYIYGLCSICARQLKKTKKKKETMIKVIQNKKE